MLMKFIELFLQPTRLLDEKLKLLYRKIPKNLNARKNSVNILKIEQCGSTIEK